MQGCSSFQNQNQRILKNPHSPMCFIATSTCTLRFYDDLLTVSCACAASSCPRLRLQSLYLRRGYSHVGPSLTAALVDDSHVLPRPVWARILAPPSPRRPTVSQTARPCGCTRGGQAHCPPRAARRLLFLLPPGFSSALTHSAALSRRLILMKPGFEEKILRVSRRQRRSRKPRVEPIARAAPRVTAQVACPRSSPAQSTGSRPLSTPPLSILNHLLLLLILSLSIRQLHLIVGL